MSDDIELPVMPPATPVPIEGTDAVAMTYNAAEMEGYARRAILADRERSAGEWLQAVLNECMRIEGCYKESDPVGTLSCLIDWHVRNAAAPPANELSDEEIERIVRETWQSDLPFSKNIIPAIRAVLAAGGRR